MGPHVGPHGPWDVWRLAAEAPVVQLFVGLGALGVVSCSLMALMVGSRSGYP